MKRIVIWVDSSDKTVEKVRAQLEDYLNKEKLQHTIWKETVELAENAIDD